MADQKETGKGIEIRKGRKRGLEGRKIEDTAGKGQRGGVEISIEKRILLIGFLKMKDLKKFLRGTVKEAFSGGLSETVREADRKDRNKLQNERGPVVRSYLETKASFIQAAGIPENRYQPFRRKTSQCGGEKLSCGGIFFKKREKKIRFQDPTGKKF